MLKIRAGEYEFSELMSMVESKMENMKIVYENSDLPDKPDKQKAQQILIEIREKFYK